MEKKKEISYEEANLGRFNNSTGSLCYMIANMHVLLNCPKFIHLVIRGLYHDIIKRKAEDKSAENDSNWEDNFKDNVIYVPTWFKNEKDK